MLYGVAQNLAAIFLTIDDDGIGVNRMPDPMQRNVNDRMNFLRVKN